MRLGGGGRMLRGNLRCCKNRDCDDHVKTTDGAMHNFYLRAGICLRKRWQMLSRSRAEPQAPSHVDEMCGVGRSLRFLKLMGLSAVRFVEDSARCNQRHHGGGGGGGNRGPVTGPKRGGQARCGCPL